MDKEPFTIGTCELCDTSRPGGARKATREAVIDCDTYCICEECYTSIVLVCPHCGCGALKMPVEFQTDINTVTCLDCGRELSYRREE